MHTENNSPYTLPSTMPNPTYKAYTLQNFESLPQVQKMTKEQKFAIEVVSNIFLFKTNNYIVEELIDWENFLNDPIFLLTFFQKKMLSSTHFNLMAAALQNGFNKQSIKETAKQIYRDLNPHPAGQIEHNVPTLEGKKLKGMQHKYKKTVLFFPSQGQACHAYCSFCFRWPQFIGLDDLKFTMKETKSLINYLHSHPEISDVLFTGGDPLVMRAETIACYIRALLKADLSNLKTIRIGTKALGNWPYRFLTDSDADDLLALFKEVVRSGKHLAFMAHFSHPRELQTVAVREAISRIHETGAKIRTQSPVLARINDQPEIWSEMWNEQVKLGCIPYYMFVARNTGLQHYFGVPIARALKVFRKAYQNVSGLAQTVRGPVFSGAPGKIQVLGTSNANGEKVFVLQFLQGRNPEWVNQPFFAKYDEKAIWFDELKPAFGEKKFFFE